MNTEEERLEQIRQLRNEVATMRDMCVLTRQLILQLNCVEGVRDLCCNSRILARLESALADLKRGMKPTP